MGAIAHLPKQVIFGEQTFHELARCVKQLAIRHACIIYSASAMPPSLQEFVASQFQDLDIKMTLFEMPKGEPTIQLLEQCVQLLRDSGCEGIVAIGGGSTLDLGKAAAALFLNEEVPFAELAQLPAVARLPFIAVPTTAGTGSEATKVAVITDERKGIKLNPGHPDFIPDVAILDPHLTLDVPGHITAFTGLDALTHAIEAYVSTKATVFSDMYALQAVELIGANLQRAYHKPGDIAARGNMLLGSFYAGVAFSNASTNLAHALGRALGTRFQLSHGLSVALLHPFVVAYSMDSCRERYERVAQAIGLEKGEALVGYLDGLNEEFHVWESAVSIVSHDFEGAIDEMTMNALGGNGILTNRRIPERKDIKNIYIALAKRLQKERQINGV